MAKRLLIGIDGGGTHSTAVAAYPDGRIAAVAYGGGLNFHNIGVTPVRERMEALVDELCRKAACPAEKVCVGLSALDGPADEATLSLFTTGTLRPDQLDLQSDAYIALMGATQGEPGVIVICGTGSMLLALDAQGQQHVSGGWGYLLGDAGSGYTLAREGLLAAIDYAEGLGPSTPLLEDALSFFKVPAPRALIDRIYAPDATPDQLAGFARCVLGRATEEDPAACSLLERNMQRLAAHAAGLISRAPECTSVRLYGGIFAHSALARSIFTRELQQRSPAAHVAAPEYPPELGALIHLLRQQNALTDEVLATLKTTYEEAHHERH